MADLSAISPVQLAWRLRPDLRAGRAAAEPVSEDFAMWWLVDAAREYPAAVSPEPGDYVELFTPLDEGTSLGWFGVTPLLQHMFKWRSDLRETFDLRSEDGQRRAIAWLYAHGLREYRLLDMVDTITLAELDKTPPFLYLPDAPLTQNPDPTWLMYLVWLSSSELQQHFSLDDREGQQAYLEWFLFTGVDTLGLTALMAPRWRKWLAQRLTNTPGRVPLPRVGLLLWKQRPELRQAFNLNEDQGWAALTRWVQDNRHSDPALRWLWEAPVAERRAARGKRKPKQRPFGLNLIGFAFGELGIGEDLRMAVAACEAAGIPFTVLNIHAGDGLRQADQALAGFIDAAAVSADQQAPYAINLFCLTGFDTGRVFLERGEALFNARYNIGWWPWELPVWPRDWPMAFQLVDEVWAATEFTRAMYEQALEQARGTLGSHKVPVTRMPLPATVARVTPRSRQQLGLPEDKFLFLYVFDFNSYLARKNPFAAVAAFRKAFPPRDRDVGLVLKTMNGDPDHPVWRDFLRECAKDQRIIVLDTTMERGEVLGLIQCCDAYVSLHRSEGFGRTLAEAMLFGKPVVATDFSGNVDFLKKSLGFPVQWSRMPVYEGEYPFITPADKAWWANPDIPHAAEQLGAARQAASDPAFTARVQKFAEKCFSPAHIGALMQQRLADIK